MTDIEKNGAVTEEQPVDGKAVAMDYGEEDGGGASWAEVCRTCFCHPPIVWAMIVFRLFWVLFFLFFFILGLEILGDGAQVLTGCVAGALFGDDQNPVSSLMIGILVTCLLQSSSTTTSIIVTLVGAGAVSVNQGIYMVFGANIGTSITNTIVAMGQLGDGDQLERAFAGATVHDMFNFLSVAIFFPLEWITGMFAKLTAACVKNAQTTEGDTRDSFVGKYIEPIGQALIIVNKKVTKEVAQGKSCADYYPTVCDDPANPTGDTCTIGLIACPKDGEQPCPALFQAGATQVTDQTSGLVAFFVGLTILFICLGGLVTVLSQMLMGVSSDIIYKATNINGYLAILIGCGLTVAVQSSSITTSTLTPLVGMDLIRIEQMFPFTLGANIGTTVTGLMAALVTEGTDSLQVALAHLFFNVFGIIVWYPIPFMRAVPMHAARQLGKATRAWKGFPILYILVAFFALPMLLLAVSSLFTSGQKGQVIAGSIIVVILFFVVVGLIYWWARAGGRDQVGAYFAKRQRRVNALETLPYDMAWAQRRIKEIQDHAGVSPADVVTTKSENPDIYADVANEMDHVMKGVKALVYHVGLQQDVDADGLGRFYNKSKEEMPSVDMTNNQIYKLTIIAVGAICLALYLTGVGMLFRTGSVATKGMAGWLLVMLALFFIWRIHSRLTGNGVALSDAAYIDKELKKMYKGIYTERMAQLKADILKLTVETQMPSLDEIGKKEVLLPTSDDDTNGATNEEMSA